MIVWVTDPTKQDIIQTLMNIPYRDIVTPIANEEGLVVNNFQVTPLYHHLYQFSMDVSGSTPAAMDHLNHVLEQIDTRVLTFTLHKEIAEPTSFALMQLLKILLYKHFGLVMTNMMINDKQIQPMDFIHVDKQMDEKIHDMIDVDALVGWKPLIDIDQLSVSLDMASSDLIWKVIEGNQIRNIDTPLLGIPVMRVAGDLDLKSTRYELGYDTVTTIVSQLYDLINNTTRFDNDDQIKTILAAQRHPIIYETPQYIYTSQTPLVVVHGVFNYILTGEWIWIYKSNFTSMATLQYATRRALYDVYKKDNLLLPITDIRVYADLTVMVPAAVMDMPDFVSIGQLISNYMKSKIYIQRIGSNNSTKANNQDHLVVNFKVLNQWVAVSTTPFTQFTAHHQFR